ncbi:MAG: CbbQ/NirQ/NorQ/GpvN family protein [Ectothiorhodospiraceae bacterium]|nr:CbbQ/NirQ/NorQ/GpvN family protein [Chromatiales bacterium]MCP5154106.1 CbbQ/NirQ/NorQ/GpvN family protein [Ectothiorhodospiraceae bacterium]
MPRAATLLRDDSTTETPVPYYLPAGEEVAIFEHAFRNRLPVLVKGPTGCGKSRFVEHMAARLGRPLYTVACHDDLTAADLVGRHLIGDAGTYWCDGPLTRAVREGAICYLDEVVEARKDTTVVLHPLTDHRRTLYLERTGETLPAPPGFMLVVSYNPGYQNLLKGMKPSTRQRFVSLAFDYPGPEAEAAIVARESGVEAQTAQRIVALAASVRALAGHDLEETVGTRLLVHAGVLMRSGASARSACRAAIVESLTDEPQTVDALMAVIDANLGSDPGR